MEGRFLKISPGLTSASQLWRALGLRVILAQFDEDSIVVYQCYNAKIAQYAAEHKRFQGAPGFSTTRMTWVKSNFLWAMYRSDILAIWLKWEAFEEMLQASKHSVKGDKAKANANGTHALKKSPNRIQWDPQHSPDGEKLRQRALQLGVRDPKFATGEYFVDIQDITPLVLQQRPLAEDQKYPWKGLMVPVEEQYVIRDDRLKKHLTLDAANAD